MADPETIYNWRRLDDRITTSGLKIKNRDYSQAEGRGHLFNGPRQKPEEPYHGRLQR